MKIKILNLAQVKEAIIDNRDLMILIGDNGTGKTLILETISLISNFYVKSIKKDLNDFMDRNSELVTVETNLDTIKYKISEKLNIKVAEDDNIVMSPLIEKFKINFTVKNSDKINSEYNKKIKSLIPEVKDQVNTNILLNNQSKFNFEFEELPSFTENYECEINIIDYHGANHLIINMDIEGIKTSEHISTRRFLYNKNTEHKLFTEETMTADKILSIIEKHLKKMLLQSKHMDYFGEGELLYLPSERNLLMDSALRKASISSLDSNFHQRYSDRLFNSAYLDFKDIAERYPEVINLLSKELQPLFGGELGFAENGELETIRKADGTVIRRELFSTKQNRTIPYLLIESPSENYRRIIIEEPEAHLSIKSMNELLTYIKDLIISGKNIIITTHSDVFYSRLNNILLEDEFINAKVYELKSDGNQSILEEKKRTESGYKIDLFSNELNDLYEETLRIQKEKNNKL